jgi:hypothetical protein
MNQSHGSTNDEQRDMDSREVLVEESIEPIFEAYDRALADGVSKPVVFLIDCEDEIGSEIARAWDGDDSVDGALLASAAQNVDDSDSPLATVLSRPADFSDCQREIPDLFPYLAASFKQPPDDGILVVVVAFGGAGTFAVPLGARGS